ncbi:MAG: radical SAM protein, partial [Bacilli bacterium]
MKYEGAVYRPPSEANSIILQVTIGCSHNKCTFCSMYKDKEFRIRNTNEILEEIRYLSTTYPKSFKKFFLADGDALVIPTEELVKIILEIKKFFPHAKISSYATAKDVLNKSKEELQHLNSLGLELIYIGLESGNNEVLNMICKDITRDEMIEAGKKLKAIGFKLSIMVISGLGGISLSNMHAIDSADVLNKINPDFISLLTLMISPNTKLHNDITNNRFKLLTPKQIMEETFLFIKKLNVSDCIFRSNHASNYISLAA